MRPGLSSRERSSPPAGSAFSAPADCAPWVLGDLWPAELGTDTTETTALADYLNADLRRIADSANDKLQNISRAGLAGPARQAAETRVISTARRFAELRIESTLRQLGDDTTRSREATPPREPAPTGTEILGAHRAEPTGETIREPLINAPDAADAPAELDETDDQRLRRLLEFAARQEPRLHWAVGSHPDGTTLLVTDLAHGWIPSGVELPAGVRLLEPGRQAGSTAALLSGADRIQTYAPGDRLERPTEFGPTAPSTEPRKLPVVPDLGETLSEAVRRRDGLPPIATTLAEAGAAGTMVVDAELDLLRVQLDTARYQLLAQYPDVDADLLLNCMLLAATAAAAAADEVSANYHLLWFQVLSSGEPGSDGLE